MTKFTEDNPLDLGYYVLVPEAVVAYHGERKCEWQNPSCSERGHYSHAHGAFLCCDHLQKYADDMQRFSAHYLAPIVRRRSGSSNNSMKREKNRG